MKRSEMIKAIHEKLDGTPVNQQNYAEQFLDVIEELGMSPPWSIGLRQVLGTPGHIWEPENYDWSKHNDPLPGDL